MGEMSIELENRSTDERNHRDIIWPISNCCKVSDLSELCACVNPRSVEASSEVPSHEKSKQNMKMMHRRAEHVMNHSRVREFKVDEK